MIKCYIFGDDSTKQLINNFIPALSPVFYLGSSLDFRTAFKDIVLNKPDFIFVDCELVNADPFEIILLKQISPVLFTTGIKHEAEVQNSKKVIKSPDGVQPEVVQMLEEVGIAVSEKRPNKDDHPIYPITIIIKTNSKGLYGGIEVLIKLDEIIYVESVKNYLDIHLDGNRHHRSYMTLKSMENELSGDFERVNKSFIINLNKITSIEGNDFLILNYNEKNRIPIGPTYKKQFAEWKKGKQFKSIGTDDDSIIASGKSS